MPAVAGGDEDGVDVSSCQQFTKVAIRGAILVAVLAICHILDRLAPVGPDIAGGQKLRIRLRQHGTAGLLPRLLIPMPPTVIRSLAATLRSLPSAGPEQTRERLAAPVLAVVARNRRRVIVEFLTFIRTFLGILAVVHVEDDFVVEGSKRGWESLSGITYIGAARIRSEQQRSP